MSSYHHWNKQTDTSVTCISPEMSGVPHVPLKGPPDRTKQRPWEVICIWKSLPCWGRGCVVGWSWVWNRQQVRLGILKSAWKTCGFSKEQTLGANHPFWCPKKDWQVWCTHFICIQVYTSLLQHAPLAWIYWLIPVVMRDNIGIWSEHHQTYPWSPSHPQDTRPIPPILKSRHKLLLKNPASCLCNWLNSTNHMRSSPGLVKSVIALFSVFIACTQSDGALEEWFLCLIILCEDNYWTIAVELAPASSHTHIPPESFAFKAFYKSGAIILLFHRNNAFCSIMPLCPLVHIPWIMRIIGSELVTLVLSGVRQFWDASVVADCLWCFLACVKGIGDESQGRHDTLFKSQDDWRNKWIKIGVTFSKSWVPGSQWSSLTFVFLKVCQTAPVQRPLF